MYTTPCGLCELRWVMSTALGAFAVAIPTAAFSQVTLDGTMGPDGALTGPNYEITDDLGTRTGDNLFHSFQDFSIDTGESATFSGPDEIANIISRVTGENRSNIDGTLRSTMPEADFYFINPNGVTFGPNATLDVQGSFHVSTADELRFGDDEVFSAKLSETSGLSVASPQDFGFFDAAPGSIVVNSPDLAVAGDDATLSLVGGDIEINEKITNENGANINIRSESGDISIFDNGAIETIDGADIAVTANDGDIAIDNGGTINTTNGGDIELTANEGNIQIVGNESSVDVEGGGDLTINSNMLTIKNGGFVRNSTLGKNDAGDITVNVSDQIMISDILGNKKETGIRSQARTGSSGNSGKIKINMPEGRLIIRNGGFISTTTFGAGDAGLVDVMAKEILIEVNDLDMDEQPTGIFSRSDAESSGLPGIVFIDAQSISISDVRPGNPDIGPDDERIFETGISTTFAGNRISLEEESSPGRIHIEAISLDLDGPRAGVESGTRGTTQQQISGGIIEIVLTGGRLSLSNGADIGSDSANGGNAGSVTIEADEIEISALGDNAPEGTDDDTKFSFINSQATPSSTGSAGTVRLTARNFIMRGAGALVDSTVRNPKSAGRAGIVEVNAESMEINGGKISTKTAGTGVAGGVTLSSNNFVMRDGAQVESDAPGQGQAGNVLIGASTIDIRDSFVTTNGGGAEGGRIGIGGSQSENDNLTRADYILLQDARVSANGIILDKGEESSIIDLGAQAVVISGRTTVQANNATGGEIAGSFVLDIDAAGSLILDSSSVEATSSVTVGGLIDDFGSQLIILDSQFVDTSRLIRESCETGGDVENSTFVSAGKLPMLAAKSRLLPGFYSSSLPPGERIQTGATRPSVIPCS